MLRRQQMLVPKFPNLSCFPLIMRTLCMLIPSYSKEVQQQMFNSLPHELATKYARVESTLSKFYGRSIGSIRLPAYSYTKSRPELRRNAHAFDFIITNISQPIAARILRYGGLSLCEAAYAKSVLDGFRKGEGLPFTIQHRLVRKLHLPTESVNVNTDR